MAYIRVNILTWPSSYGLTLRPIQSERGYFLQKASNIQLAASANDRIEQPYVNGEQTRFQPG